MFGRRRVPVLRLDRLPGAAAVVRAPSDTALPKDVRYSFAPETPQRSLSLHDCGLDDVLQSVGTGADKAVARFARSLGERTIGLEVLGSARLHRLVLRWFDTGLKNAKNAPWYFAKSNPTGSYAHVPLGDVPETFLELSPDEYGTFSGLDLASVPAEAIVTTADAVRAAGWFLATWPDETSPVLDWRDR